MGATLRRSASDVETLFALLAVMANTGDSPGELGDNLGLCWVPCLSEPDDSDGGHEPSHSGAGNQL